MSNENNFNQIITKVGSSVTDLQKNNPKVFYGAVGVILIVFVFTFVGSGAKDSGHVAMTLVNGNTYVVKNPNGGGTLLLSQPAFGSAESGDDMNICVVEPGVSVRLEEQTIVNYINYIKISPVEGPCQGKSGWTSKVNLKL